MSNYDLEEDSLLKIQIFLSIIFIFTLIVSITLSYNSMMECENKNKIYSDKDALRILRINRIISLIVSLGFLLINIYDKLVKEKYEYKDNNADLQIMASMINVAASRLVLYITFNGSTEIIGNENP